MSKTKNGTNFSVQDMIDILKKVKDKSRGFTLYASTDNPEKAGVLEIFGRVFDVDTDVLKEEPDCNDVVIQASATDFQVSTPEEQVNQDEVSDTLDLLEFMLNQYSVEQGEENADKVNEFIQWARKDKVTRVQ